MRVLAAAMLALLGMTSPLWANCSEMVRLPWKKAAHFSLGIEAHALGPVCASSAVAILVANARGEVLWATTRLAQENAWFRDGIKNKAAMKKALKDWLQSGIESSPTNTSALPEWKAGAAQPEREGDGEFGFYGSDQLSRDYYLELRAAKHPIFCFVQGIESTTCIVATRADNVVEIGGFTFPG